MTNRPYTKYEEDFIKENYNTYFAREIATMIGRSKGSITWKIDSMNLKITSEKKKRIAYEMSKRQINKWKDDNYRKRMTDMSKKQSEEPNWKGFKKGHPVPIEWRKKFSKTNSGRVEKRKTKVLAVICPYCGECFLSPRNVVADALNKGRNLFCSRECCANYRSENYSGENHPMYGKKHSEESKKKIKDALPKRFGEDSANWKGGVTTENNLLRWCQENKDLRKRVFERDDYTCQICGHRSGNGIAVPINAHHIKSWAEYPELRFEDTNCITLCVPCHKKIHKVKISFNNEFSWTKDSGDIRNMEGFKCT